MQEEQNAAVNIEELCAELERFRAVTRNIENILDQALREEVEENPQGIPAPPELGEGPINQDRRPRQYLHDHPVVRDQNGVEILIGDTVIFVTRGLFTSTRGIIYKITPSGTRVMARDNLRRSISRAPYNVIVEL